jgi:DNA-binding FrmR family transcriptional regulator
VAHAHPRKPDVAAQLASIEGHVRTIKQMAEQGKPYAEILHQVNAVQASLRKVAQLAVVDHLENCALDAHRAGQRPRGRGEPEGDAGQLPAMKRPVWGR